MGCISQKRFYYSLFYGVTISVGISLESDV